MSICVQVPLVDLLCEPDLLPSVVRWARLPRDTAVEEERRLAKRSTSRAMSLTLSGTTPVEAHATVGKQDHLAILSEAVDQRRTSVVEVAAEVLQADQRRRFPLGPAELPIDKRRSLDCDRAVLSIQRAADARRRGR